MALYELKNGKIYYTGDKRAQAKAEAAKPVKAEEKPKAQKAKA